MFAEKLRHRRIARGLDQTVLARTVGLQSPAHISHLEAGRKEPSILLVCRLARVLACSTDYFLMNTIAVSDMRSVKHEANRAFLGTTGNKIRHLRRQHGLTQTVLAHQLGLRDHKSISFVESQQREPSLAFVVQSAVFFGVTTDFLLWDDEGLSP